MEGDTAEDQSDSAQFSFLSKDMSILEEQKKKVLRERAKHLKSSLLGYECDSNSDTDISSSGRDKQRCEPAQSGRSETSIFSNGSVISRKSISRRTPNVVATDHRNLSGQSLNLNASELKRIRGGADGDRHRQSPSFTALEKKLNMFNDEYLVRPMSSHEFHRGDDSMNYEAEERPATARSFNRDYDMSSPECTPRVSRVAPISTLISPRCVSSYTSVDTVIHEEDEPGELNNSSTEVENATENERKEAAKDIDESDGESDSTVTEVTRDKHSKKSLSNSSTNSVVEVASEKLLTEVSQGTLPEANPSVTKSPEKSSSSEDGIQICPQTPLSPTRSEVKSVQYPSKADYGISVNSSTKISMNSYGTKVNNSPDNQKVTKSSYDTILNMFIVEEAQNYDDYYNGRTNFVKKILDEKATVTDKFYNMQTNGDEITYSLSPNHIVDNLELFALHPVPPGFMMKCRITRNRKGIDKNFFPIYYLHLERDDGKKNLLMLARKRKKSTTSNYMITTDPSNLSKESESVVGSCRSNLLGTTFSCHDGFMSYKRFKFHERIFTNQTVLCQYREELAVVLYETNILGFKGPRKMDIVIPKMMSASARMESRPEKKETTIMEKLKRNEMEHLQLLKNKTPVWNTDNQSYVLNFHGRVTQASVKNFQLVTKDNDIYCGLQFGRVAQDVFHLDFGYPLCPLQAFSIVLSSFDSKLACE